MILAIDIGNTNIVLGGIENTQIVFVARMATDVIKTSDQYHLELKNMLKLFSVDTAKLEGTIISSVVPPVLHSIHTAILKMTGCEPLIVGPGIRTGLNVHVDNPKQVGSDLIVAAVAGMKEYGAPLMIVDMGTATTITVIDENKSFRGGAICPGVRISMDALTSRTAQLPGISLEAPKQAIGRNTVDCMQSGIMLGAAAMLDGLLDRMEEELGREVPVVATGGISQFVIPLCRRKIIYDKNLLLKGLNILYRNNMRA